MRRALALASVAIACAHAEGRKRPLEEAARLDAQVASLFAVGAYGRAVGPARRSVALKEEALGASSLEVAASLHQLARVLWSEGELDAAREAEQRALAIRERSLAPSSPQIADSLNVLGAVAAESADYAAAIPLYERALRIREAALGPESAEVAQSLNNIATVLTREGDSAQALSLFERALRIREKALGPDSPVVAWALNNVAAIHLSSGAPAEALPLFERALAIWQRSEGADHPDVAVGLSAEAAALRDEGDYARAATLVQRALAIRQRAAGADDAASTLSLGELAELKLALGDAPAARPLLDRALAIQERSLGADHPWVATTLDLLAREARARGDLARAAALSRRALAIVEKSVARNVDALTERQQIAFLAVNRRFLDALLSTPGVPDAEAYGHVLAWKGAAALIASARQLQAWAREDRAGAAGEGLSELRRVRAQLSQLALSAPDGDEAKRRLDARVAALTERERQLDAELARESAGFRARAAFLSAGVPELCARLPEGAALVDFLAWRAADAKPPPPLAHPDRVSAFVLLPEACTVRRVELPQGYAAVAKAAEAWRAAAASDAGALAERRGRALRKLAFDPLLPALGAAKTLLVAPDGPLASVAFGALPLKGAALCPATGGAQGRVACGDGRAVIEAFDLAYLDSGKDLARDAPAAPGGARPPLVVGGADYGAKPAATSGGCPIQLPPLPGALAEAELVAKHLDGAELLTGAAATERAFRQGAARRRVLHVATHGFFLPARCAAAGAADPMLLSGLAFTPGRQADPADDGLLTAADLATFDLRGTGLVVLSACDSGRGEIVDGQGVLGLRRAVFSGGARALVMSLWRVPDQDTRDLMDRFYAHLATAKPAEALRAAQLELLAKLRAEGAEDAPLRVAGFVAAGR